MTSELIVDVQADDVSIALLEDKTLVEFQKEGRSEQYAVGNIYLARVRKLMPGLNACFVNVGSEHDAFLHYSDLTQFYPWRAKYLETVLKKKNYVTVSKVPCPEEETGKEGSIQNALKQGDQVLVQVIKEPISTKGPRLSCELSFAGRYLVLMPFDNKVNVSTKITNRSERARLKQIVQKVKPKQVGIIIRTVAEGCKAEELENEIRILFNRWEETVKAAVSAPAENKATLVYEETSRAVGMLRDLFNPSYANIYVNDKQVFEEISDYVGMIAPDRKKIVKHYTGNLPIFDNFDVTRQIKASLGRIVTYKHGAYMYIEHTEALHVVDINSGNRMKNAENHDQAALEVNLLSADELARQIRLRDMGGIIVVDFIDMQEPEHRQALYERMCQNMEADRARHTILPLSKFGLMQITRQRVRPSTEIKVEEDCPTCHGTGMIKSSLMFTDTLESKIDALVNVMKIKKFTLFVHPFVAAYINQGFWSLARRWKFHYGRGVKILPNQQLSYLQYQFFDAKGEEIDMREQHESH